MNAVRIALLIRKHGFPVINVEEGDHDMDGMVEINEKVHINVPTYGRKLCVAAEVDNGTAFRFYPERNPTDWPLICADIRTALEAKT